jgi:hypothetical protein
MTAPRWTLPWPTIADRRSLNFPFDPRVARAVRPIVVDDRDAELLKLTSFLRDAVEPRVTTALLSHAVPMAGGGHVVVVRISSPNAPHRVVRNGQFYVRNSVGKEQMDIHAIRSAFAFADGLAERAVAFRDGRLSHLGEGRPTRPVTGGPQFVCHVVPVSSLTRRGAYPVSKLKAAAAFLQASTPAGYSLQRAEVNYEGVICASKPVQLRQHVACAQLFRDGFIELVGTSFTQHPQSPLSRAITLGLYELALVRSTDLEFPPSPKRSRHSRSPPPPTCSSACWASRICGLRLSGPILA